MIRLEMTAAIAKFIYDGVGRNIPELMDELLQRWPCVTDAEIAAAAKVAEASSLRKADALRSEADALAALRLARAH